MMRNFHPYSLSSWTLESLPFGDNVELIFIHEFIPKNAVVLDGNQIDVCIIACLL
jgi:hypothetical protein